MQKPSILICGKLSKMLHSSYSQVLKINEEKYDVAALFVDFSEFDIDAGYVFNQIIDVQDSSIWQLTECRLLAVSQQFILPFDSIPSGWKTICSFAFEFGKIPDVVQDLPELVDWYETVPRLRFS